MKQLMVSWNPNIEEDVAKYHVYQNGVLIRTVDKNVLSIETEPLPDGDYSFFITCEDTSGNISEPSDPVVFELNVPPAKPTGLKVLLKN